jgi:hypothetical protein
MDQRDLALLQDVPIYHLQSMVRMRRISLPSQVQLGEKTVVTPALAEEIGQQLFSNAQITGLLPELRDVDHLVLQELVACGGRANSRDLAFYFTSSGLLEEHGPGEGLKPEESTRTSSPPLNAFPAGSVSSSSIQYPVAHPHGIFEQTIRHLLLLGLVFWGRQTNFAGREYNSGMHDGVLIVPYAVREVVTEVWLDKQVNAELAVLNEGEQLDIGARARDFQRSLYLYWSFVFAQRDGLSMVQSGSLARSSLRQVVEHMQMTTQSEQIRQETDAPSLLFIRLLLLQLGVLYIRNSTIYATSSPAFFALPLVERVRLCCHTYLTTPFWNELFYLPDVIIRSNVQMLEPAHEEVVRSRQIVAERLLAEDRSTWHTFTAFIARTKLYAPYLLFPRQYGGRVERYSAANNPYGWDFRLRHGWLTHREGWHMVEGGFIRALVSGPFYWLGIAELDRLIVPNAFRLDPLVSALFSSSPIVVSEAAPGRLVVQPNFELIVLDPVYESLLVALDHFAERVSLEHIAQYRMNKSSVTRGIQRGLHASDIQATLEQAAQGDVPQNVRYSLNEWERQARRVEIWPSSTLFEVDDPAFLDTFLSDPRTSHLFQRRLSPTLAEVTPQQLQQLQELLWEQNIVPAVSSADEQKQIGTVLPREHETQWRLHDAGLLQPIYSVSDLYVVAEAERFCVRDESSGWLRITAASLQNALHQGMTLAQIIAYLQHFCLDGIPPALLIRLKLWGGGYAASSPGPFVAVEHTPLLAVHNDVLQDLLADASVAMLLGTVVDAQTRLLHVRDTDLPALLALLRQRGFTIDD